MKRFILLTFIILSFSFLQVSCRKRYSVPEITYIDRIMVKVYDTELNDSKITEYISPEESLEDWTTLFAVRHYRDDISPEDIISAMIIQIEKLGRDEELLHTGILSASVQEDEGVFFLEFIIEGRDFLEYNLLRYIPGEAEGLTSYHLARRISMTVEPSYPYGSRWAEENIDRRRSDIRFIFSSKLQEELKGRAVQREENIPIINKRRGLS